LLAENPTLPGTEITSIFENRRNGINSLQPFSAFSAIPHALLGPGNTNLKKQFKGPKILSMITAQTNILAGHERDAEERVHRLLPSPWANVA
jgi:hypothetical protein